MNSLIHLMYDMAFGKRLATARKARGLTQEGLAGLVGLTKLQIHRYERGTSQPTMEALKKIAQALSMSIDELVFEEGERKPDQELLLLFEGVTRLDPDEKRLIKELIEGVLLKHDAKRWTTAASG